MHDDETNAGGGRRLLAASDTKECNGDTLLPLIPHENTWTIGVRAPIYLFALCYFFLGVAISADVFMSSIEVITSKTRTVMVRGQEVEIEIWNDTVANLTLMALGSSAPEILLAVVETCALKFEAGDLGPGTIVGSAAFNLLFITAICVVSLPELEDDPETLESREIEEFGVFVITAIASLWAYLWMVIALLDDEVHIWEAVFTFLMFPALVWISWAQDQGWWGMCGSSPVSPEGEEEHSKSHLKSVTGEDGKKRRQSASNQLAEAALEDVNSEELKLDPEAAPRKAAQDAMRKKKKSRLEYRIQATRKMTGGKRVLPTSKQLAASDAPAMETVKEEEGPPRMKLGFASADYKCDESCGSITVKVVRSGITDKLCTVQFDTSDGDANSTDDYVSAAGSLKFEPGETEKPIEITIIDDNEWAPDKHFYVRLYGA